MEAKYTDFNKFLIAVIKRAEQKSSNVDLKQQCSLLTIIYKILDVSWGAFDSVCGLLILTPIAFALALVAFVGSGIGLMLGGPLAMWGVTTAIKRLYNFKFIPLAIQHLGGIYMMKFDEHKGNQNYIDNLIEKASDELIILWSTNID